MSAPNAKSQGTLPNLSAEEAVSSYGVAHAGPITLLGSKLTEPRQKQSLYPKAKWFA